MTHVTWRLTAKNRDKLRNPTLSNRVWATFTFYCKKARQYLDANNCQQNLYFGRRKKSITVGGFEGVEMEMVTPLTIEKRSIVMSVSVCLSVCVRVCVCVFVYSRSYLGNHMSDLHQILCMLPMALARSYSGGVVIR